MFSEIQKRELKNQIITQMKKESCPQFIITELEKIYSVMSVHKLNLMLTWDRDKFIDWYNMA